jgi:hypothetical protein
MFEQPIVTFEGGRGFSLIGTDILIDPDEFEGVRIAAKNLCKDFAKVTGQGGNIVLTTPTGGVKPKSCIIVGTISNSKTIRQLKSDQRIDLSGIDGKWESWITQCVSNPVEGYDDALVIAGSDKRGAIFGIYSLSEQIGVSPCVISCPSPHRFLESNILAAGIGGQMSPLKSTTKFMHLLCQP